MFLRCFLFLMASGLLIPRAALAAEQSFEQWLASFRAEALEAGISESTFDSALSDAAPIQKVIDLDRHQPEFTLTFEQYLEQAVPKSRIEKGRQLLSENRELLDRVSAKYAVQPRFLVAFWGIESSYGHFTGGFSVPKALATLAFDGRRAQFFRKELLDALKIIDEGHISADKMMGSWAGAMGQTQFMPSSFRKYAVDFDRDQRRDIWATPADVFASAANYLSQSGWKDDQTWGRAAYVPAEFDRALITLDVRKKLDDWQQLGIRRFDGRDLPKRALSASLVQPGDGGDGPIFLVYDNYRTTLKWNRSTYFAVAVGHLADGIGGY